MLHANQAKQKITYHGKYFITNTLLNVWKFICGTWRISK